MIIYVIGIANVILQFLTRNTMFAYFGFICLFIYALSLFVKQKKIILICGIVSLLCVTACALYNHYLFGYLIGDYIAVAVESVLTLTVFIVYMLQSKEPPSIEGGSVSFKGQVEFAIHPKSFPYAPQIELLHTLINLIY